MQRAENKPRELNRRTLERMILGTWQVTEKIPSPLFRASTLLRGSLFSRLLVTAQVQIKNAPVTQLLPPFQSKENRQDRHDGDRGSSSGGSSTVDDLDATRHRMPHISQPLSQKMTLEDGDLCRSA